MLLGRPLKLGGSSMGQTISNSLFQFQNTETRDHKPTRSNELSVRQASCYFRVMPQEMIQVGVWIEPIF